MTSRIWWVPMLICIGLSARAHAGPKRVLVLPLDGNADGATRSKVNAVIQKLARSTEGGPTVTVGHATYDETAAAVGCDPAAPKCAVSVRTTLGVDELVYGTVTTDPSGQLTIVIRHSSVTDNPPKETTATLASGQSPDEAERQLAPMFGVTVAAPPPPPEKQPPAAVPSPAPAQPARDNMRRNVGIACATGGGVLLVIGLIAWSSESSKQDDVDDAPTATVADLMHLRDLEDDAQRYAIAGDVLVLAGLALGGYGGWLLYKDHKERRSVIVTPAVTPAGPAVTIGGVW